MKHLLRVDHVRWRLTPCKISLMHLTSLLLIFFRYQSHYKALAFCPAKCHCVNGNTNSQAYCIDAALEDVPIQLNPETKYINLTLNKIRNIEYALPFYTYLEILDLSRNIIETLGSKNFEYQTKMFTLNLSQNSVSALHKDAFKGLRNLLVLDLSFNRIEMIHMTAMTDLKSLLEMDLTNNNIVSLEDNTWHNCMSLEILIFKNNQLLDVPATNLQNLLALKSLDLSENLVQFVGNESFENLHKLMSLTLRDNVISELELRAFDGLITLKHMDLANNNLTIVPTQQLSKLYNLTHLTLSGNRFTYLPAVAFLNLFHLRELHLNRLDLLQSIDSRAFVDNTHLQILQLSRNLLLSDIPMRLFQGNPNIIEVYMQANSLQILYAIQFPIDQLKKLYLGDNPLQCNCTLFWLWRLITANFDNTTKENNLKMKNEEKVQYNEYEDLMKYTMTMETDAPNIEDDNLVKIAAYVTERKREIAHKFQSFITPSTSFSLRMDSERIECEVWHDRHPTRKHLAAMSESDITCSAHVVTIVYVVLTVLLVIISGTTIVLYGIFVRRRRKLLYSRSLCSGNTITNVHDRIVDHQPLSGESSNIVISADLINTQLSFGLTNVMHPLHYSDHHQNIPQADKLELECYLTAQAKANDYREPWELPPIKNARNCNTYIDEPEHLYEKFDHYDYPHTQTVTNKSLNSKLVIIETTTTTTSNHQSTITNTTRSNNMINTTDNLSKSHVVYV